MWATYFNQFFHGDLLMRYTFTCLVFLAFSWASIAYQKCHDRLKENFTAASACLSSGWGWKRIDRIFWELGERKFRPWFCSFSELSPWVAELDRKSFGAPNEITESLDDFRYEHVSRVEDAQVPQFRLCYVHRGVLRCWFALFSAPSANFWELRGGLPLAAVFNTFLLLNNQRSQHKHLRALLLLRTIVSLSISWRMFKPKNRRINSFHRFRSKPLC